VSSAPARVTALAATLAVLLSLSACVCCLMLAGAWRRRRAADQSEGEVVAPVEHPPIEQTWVPFSPRIPVKPIPWYWYAYGDAGPPAEAEVTSPGGGFLGGENPEAPQRQALLSVASPRHFSTVF